MENKIDNRNRRAKNDRQSIVSDNRFITNRRTNSETNRRTGQKLYAPDLSIRGHKNTMALP
jgi:hypothetical protein